MRRFSGRAVVLLAALIYGWLAGGPILAFAQANTSTIVGTVSGANGAPIAGARVLLTGVQRAEQTTDQTGAFKFTVTTGLYSMLVSKAGYETYENDSIGAFTGETLTVNVTLSAASFSSLRTIANVSTNAPGVAPINKSTASISTISGATFANQGQQQVTKILNETPGIITSPLNPGNGNPSNGASPASPQTPQIRGALPYETESLIDGHPVSVGASGYYSANLLNPWLLQDVELVKGPGSMPEEINYAVNGTINYRTLEPTAQTRHAAMLGYDNWGGVSTGFKATGFTSNHKFGYAVGYVTNGAPGPLHNFTYSATQLPLASGPPGGPYFINGQQVAMIGGPVGIGLGSSQFAPYDGMGLSFVDPVVGCCFKSDTGYHSTSELGKLLYNFSNNTSFTLSYLGGQSVNGNGDPNFYSSAFVGTTSLPATYFAPCGTPTAPLSCNPYAPGTSYNCTGTSKAPTCNSAVPFDVTSVNGAGYTWTQQNLFQGEFRTTLGSTGTVLARYYTGSLNQYALLGSSGAQLNYSLNTYGTIPLCPTGDTFVVDPTSANFAQCANPGGTFDLPTDTTFTGQKATFSTANFPNTSFTNDTMNGETLQLQEMLGENTVTFAYDRSEQASTATANEPSVGIIVFSPYKGSKQTFQTFSVRGNIRLNPKLQLNVGDYAINYLSHYTLDKGATWHDSSHTYNAPRAAITWTPNNDTALRFSTGGSVAPPYISLVSSGGGQFSQIIGGVPAAGYILNINNGNINAETAWGYDLGMDRRVERDTSISLDLYATNLKDMFLDSTSVVTVAQAAAYGVGCNNAPCVLSKTVNLGHARYEGVELSAEHTPIFGLGWRVQGSFQRAYTYDLPADFYCLVPGPNCIKNTNLAVIPNVNFGGQPTALAGAPNGIGSARVPYATGYGELNWTAHHGQYYNLGITYFGNNNSYNVPPFAVVSGNVRFNLTNYGTRLQISGDNLTNAYPNSYVGFFNGIPLPLVKGAAPLSAVTGAYTPTPFAVTPQGNYGPATIRLILTQDF
jgi:hypothetical protein